MNENINLCEILKDCPKGTKLYSPIFGEVKFDRISYGRIIIECIGLHLLVTFNQAGKYLIEVSENNGTYFSSECLLFPSKDQRDWNKFKAPWLNKLKFDPKTLQPFDKVLTRESPDDRWYADFVSMPPDKFDNIPYTMSDEGNNIIIPYNDETKYLVGTSDEAPEYYRYWED